MPGLKPEFESRSIVLVGAFNPAIYQPAWLGRMGLLREEEVENAKVEIIHRDITSITIGTRGIQVQPRRFLANTRNSAEYEILRDLVVAIFKILPHTPAHQLGINSEAHFKLNSEAEWHAVGHCLAPKELWKKFFVKPGLRSLIMENPKEDGKFGYTRVKVEPSTRVKFGVFISINDHYEIQDYKPEDGCEAIIDILISSWSNSLKQTQVAYEVLLEAAHV